MNRKKRIEQQFLQLRDMVDDHHRMALVDLQPTEQERNDLLALLTAIRDGIRALPPNTAKELKRQYETLAKSVSDLQYTDSDDFALTIAEPAAAPEPVAAAPAALQSISPEPVPRTQAAKKTVRFNDMLEQRYTDDPSRDASPQSQSQVQLYNENERLFEDQDRRLDEMSLSVSRQRELGLSINQELDTHNDLLDGLEEQTDHSQSRLNLATQSVAKFNRKARECGTCSIIMALVLILIVVIII